MTEARRVDIGNGLSFRLNKWMCRFPLPKQAVALALCEQGKDVLYGGAAGGGKTDALLMAALQYVDVPGYKAAITRRTHKQLTGLDGIITRSQEWGLGRMGAHWNDTSKVWTFPSGAKLQFFYLDHIKHKDNFQGQDLHFSGKDEVTQWGDQTLCTYPETRLRTTKEIKERGVPIRRFNTGNPGGSGHVWVKRRWVDSTDPRYVYVPASVHDNPYLDSEEYLDELRRQGELVFQRLGLGDWDAEQGEIFNREWFKIINARDVPDHVRWCHSIDTAASAKARADNNASGFIGVDRQGNIYIEDLQAWKAEWPETKGRLIKRILARPDPVIIEGIGGGLVASQDLLSDPRLTHITIRVLKHKADKVSMTMPWAARAQAGKVFLVDGPHIDDFMNEAIVFPSGRHDDRIDVVNNGVHHLGVTVGSGGGILLPPPPSRQEVIF